MFRGLFDDNVTAHVFVPLNLGRPLVWNCRPCKSSKDSILRLLDARGRSIESGSRFRVRAYPASSDIHLNNYNCGVFLVLFAEEIFFGKLVSELYRHALQYLRYRNLCMCLQRKTFNTTESFASR